MAHMLKQNIENLGGSSAKRRKGNVPIEGIKKLKTFIKPLSDVKNIIEDKVSQEKAQKDIPTKSLLVPITTESDCVEELFFYSEDEDPYSDIIPKSLQIEEDDVLNLVAVFGCSTLKKCPEELVDFLPNLEFGMPLDEFVNEDLCDVIKGIDSSNYLFDDWC